MLANALIPLHLERHFSRRDAAMALTLDVIRGQAGDERGRRKREGGRGIRLSRVKAWCHNSALMSEHFDDPMNISGNFQITFFSSFDNWNETEQLGVHPLLPLANACQRVSALWHRRRREQEPNHQ